MKRMLLVLLLLVPFQALADRDYNNGNYWTVTSVDTHPGKYDSYLSELKEIWLKSIEMMKKDGKVLSYRMFNNVHARVGEPNLFLMVEWKSAADVLDVSDEYWEAQDKKLFGSSDKGSKANIERGELRTIMSETFLREVSFN